MTRARARGPHAAAIASTALAALAALGAAAPARATILLFDQERDRISQSTVSPTSSGGLLPSDYGDNVTGASMAVPGGVFTYGEAGEGFTPDVVVDIYSAAGSPTDPRVNLWQAGYGDLVNVVFAEGPGTGGAPQLDIVLTAAPGFAVDLYGFDLAGFANLDYTIAGVDVLSGTATLFSATDVLVEGDANGPAHTSFAFATPLSGPDIRIRIDLSNLASAIQDNVGLDSVRFGQTPPPIPEPGTGVLALTGVAALAVARRRSSTHRARRGVGLQPSGGPMHRARSSHVAHRVAGVAVVAGLIAALASPASADRTFDLFGTVQVSGGGTRETFAVAGQLALFDDRTYSMTVDGETSTGAWVQEGTRLTLLDDPPIGVTALDQVTAIEADVSAAAGFAVAVTSIQQAPDAIVLSRSGRLRITSRTQYTFRPGPLGRPLLKVAQRVRLEGTPGP